MTPWTIWDASESNPGPRKLFQALKIGFIRITCVFLCISFVFLSVTNIQFSSKSWKTKEIQRKIKENTRFFHKIDFESLEQFPRVRIGLRGVPGGVASHAAQYLRCPLPTNLRCPLSMDQLLGDFVDSLYDSQRSGYPPFVIYKWISKNHPKCKNGQTPSSNHPRNLGN